MKLIYEKPIMTVERFVPNEYIASCSHPEGGQIVYFECNAGGGKPGDVWLADGTNLTPNSWFWGTNYFIACNKKHIASSEDEFLDGCYHQNGGNDRHVGREIPVKIWRGDGSVHTTENLNIESWEKNHS